MSDPRKIAIDDKTILVKPFKLDEMGGSPTICMIAKRRSGKSWICREILYHFRHIPVGVIISTTEEMTKFYGKFFPEAFIYYKYKPDIIERLFARQKKMIAKCVLKFKKGKKCDPRAILVMDDCLSSKGTWMRDQYITDLFYNGRHFQIMFILTMQFPLGIIPELRANFDYVFLLADDFYSNQKRLYDHYAGMFSSFTLFRQVFMELTKDYGCMVISNAGAKSNFLEKFFHFKARPVQINSVGCKQFLDFHNNNFDKYKRSGVGASIDRMTDPKNKESFKIARVYS